MPNQRHIQEYLDTIEEKTQLSSTETDEVAALLTTPGLRHLLGILITTRQGALMQLGNMVLHSEAGRYQAAVLQGTIKGIDLVHQNLLDLFPIAEFSPEQRNAA